MTRSCIYCRGAGPFTTIEHVVPESLGNDDLVLRDCVCDACQAYFGKEIEAYVLAKTPIAVWRTLIGVRTKKGRLPAVDVSQPNRPKGRLPDIHRRHDDLGFAAHPDGSTSVDIDDDSAIDSILIGAKREFNLVLSPKKVSMLGRFLAKVGLGVLATSEMQSVYDEEFDKVRGYARVGSSEEIWPIFHYSDGDIGCWRDPKLIGPRGELLLEEIECYSYAVLEVGDRYTLFRFSIGLDSWIICLNDPYPSPVIRSAFPDQELQLIWYSPEQWRSVPLVEN